MPYPSIINIGLADNVEIINREADFPDQGATTITLKADTRYFIGAFISTPKRFIVETGASVVGIGPYTYLLESTNTGAMFTSVDANWRIDELGYGCPNGTVFDVTSNGTQILHTSSICMACQGLGSIVSTALTNIGGVLFKLSGVVDAIASGVSISGKFDILNITELLYATTGVGVNMIDFSGSEFNTMEIRDLELRGPVGSFGLVGDTGGVNMAAGSVGSIRDGNLGLPGTITPLGGGLLNGDPAYSYDTVGGVEDSRILGYAYVSTPAVTDVQDGVDVEVAGTFTEGNENSQTSVSASGRITVLNRQEKLGFAAVNLDVSKGTGSSQTYLLKVCKLPGGVGPAVDLDGVFSSITLAGGGSSQISMSGPARFIDGDTFCVTVQGVGTSEDITVTTEGFSISG